MNKYTVLYGMSEHEISAKHIVYVKDLIVFLDTGEPFWTDENELLNRQSVVAIFSANKICIRKIIQI